jgi:hypothetical protein
MRTGLWKDRMWPDGWTSVTADGKRSAQFEHTLLVCVTSSLAFKILFAAVCYEEIRNAL